MMLQCKFCSVSEVMKAIDGKLFDFYICEECQSVMCHQCTYTSIRTGNDYCEYCWRNLEYIGKKI
jgi:hypothetical protein